jgi:hypothetical protein
MGRVPESSDMPAVRGVAREAAKNNNRFSAFVYRIVISAPFQMRKAGETGPESDVGQALPPVNFDK